MNSKYSTLILFLVLILGLSLLLYPSVANYWNMLHQTHAIVGYQAALQKMSQSDYDREFAKARAYNDKLDDLRVPMAQYKQVEGYDEILNVLGDGIMGYITIPALRVELSVYHGTEEGTLLKNVGHLQGTSLPTGGAGTHSSLSAHRGLPSARLFTDLDMLVEGDIFVLHILNESFTYEVDRISIVEPHDVSELAIIEGEDYCTLITCTPYGVNSHRLLVRGRRTKDDGSAAAARITADAAQIEPLLIAPFVAMPLLLVLFIWMMCSTGKKKEDGKLNEKLQRLNKKEE